MTVLDRDPYLRLTEMGRKAETKMSAMLPWLRTAVVASKMASEMSRPGVGGRVRVRVRGRARARVSGQGQGKG